MLAALARWSGAEQTKTYALVCLEKPRLEDGHDSLVVEEERDGVARTDVQRAARGREGSHVVVTKKSCRPPRHQRTLYAVVLIRHTGPFHALVHELKIGKVCRGNILKQVLAVVRDELSHHHVPRVTRGNVDPFLFGLQLRA